MISYVQQPTFETCGQACIAMLSGYSIEEVIKTMKTKGPTSIGQLIEALDYYGIKHAEKNKRISKKNPKYSEVSIGYCTIKVNFMIRNLEFEMTVTKMGKSLLF